jgi:periplasmic protein TonB
MKVASKITLLALLIGAIAGPASADTPVWTREAVAKVATHRTTPRSAQLRGSTGTVEMEVSVDGRGMITDYRMVKSSGAPILDREADLIIMRVGSFDAPPGGAPTRVMIPIRW